MIVKLFIICAAFYCVFGADSYQIGPQNGGTARPVVKWNATARSCGNNTSQKPMKPFTPIGSRWVHEMGVYLLPGIIIFGLIGNIFSFVILKESALRIPGHLYLICLTVFDSLSLLSMIPTYWAVMIVRPYHHLVDPTALSWVQEYMTIWGVCQARLFITFYLRTLSIWTIVLFTLERMISVVWPLSGERICTVKGVGISMGVLGFVAIFVNLPWFYAFDKLPLPCSPGTVLCKGNDVLFINRMVEFLLYTLVPSVVICCANGAIIFVLRKRRHLHALYDKKQASKVQAAITRRLLAVSTAFVLLTLPMLIAVTIHTVNEFRDVKDHKTGPLADFFHISFLIFSVNLAVNFLLYCLTGPAFRKAALNLFLCRLAKMRKFRRTLLGSQSGGNDYQRTNSSNLDRSDSTGARTAMLSSSGGGRKPSTELNAMSRLMQPKVARDESMSTETTSVGRNTSNLSQNSKLGMLPPVRIETSI